MRSSMKMIGGMSAVALIGLSGTIASAGDLGLVQNGDMELVSRFTPHGDPGTGDTPAGIPDAWGHSGHTGWSNAGDPVLSGVHSLRLSDFNGAIGGIFNPPLVDATLSMEEARSFVNVLPQTSAAGDTLHIHLNWAYDITSNATDTGDQFGVVVRVSPAPDIPGVTSCCDLSGTNTTEAAVLTDAAVSTTNGAFIPVDIWINLPVGSNTFDIIFNTGNRSLADGDPGKFDVTGELFVDDVSATFVPEPASLALMGLGGLAALRRRRA